MAARELVVPASPDEVLLRAALVLKRLGARITRYDGEAGTLEARAGRRLLPEVVRLRAAAEGAERTRVAIASDTADWRALVAQLAAALRATPWR